MKLFIGATMAAFLLVGCGSDAVPGQMPAWVAGIPVRRIAWNRPLPHVRVPPPWQASAPAAYRVAPYAALQDLLQAAPYLRGDASVLYVQRASLSGELSGNTPAAYVVVAEGNRFPALGQGPATSEWMLFLIDGRTGKVTVKEAGANYGG